MRNVHIIYGAEDGVFSLRGGVGVIAQNFIMGFKKMDTNFNIKLSVFTIRPKKNILGIDLVFCNKVKKICNLTGGQLIYVDSLRKKNSPYFSWDDWSHYNKILSKKIKAIINKDEFTLIIANDGIFGNLNISGDNVAFLWIPHSLSSAHRQSYLNNSRRLQWEKGIIDNINNSKKSYVGYLSDFTKELLKNVKKEKLIYTPNGFDLDFVKKYIKSQKYIKEYLERRGIPINKKLVIAFGRADEYKGLDLAFKKMLSYEKKGYAGILIASKFNEEQIVYTVQDRIKKIAKENPESKVRLFFGYEFLLPKYLIQYKNTKILLHLPVRDYCPLVPIEAFLLNPKLKIINSSILCNKDFSKRKKSLDIKKNYGKIINFVVNDCIEISAGVFVENSQGILVVRRKDGFYSLPKGHVEKGETLKMTAIRESREETGLNIRIGRKIGVIHRSNKDIHVFAGSIVGGKLKKGAEFVSWNVLKNKMKYASDLEVIRKEGA